MREWYRGCGFCKPSKLGPYAEVDDPKEVTTMNIPLPYLDEIQKFIDLGLFDSRTQFVKMCIDRFLERELEFKESLNETDVKCKKSIVTVNMPKRVNKVIAKEFVTQFVGSRTLYPSRSELVRTAIRDYLMEVFITKAKESVLDPNIFVDRKGKQWYIDEVVENV